MEFVELFEELIWRPSLCVYEMELVAEENSSVAA